MASEGNIVLSLEQLGALHSPKNLVAFSELGGLEGLQRGLRTDLKHGLHVNETRLHGGAEPHSSQPPALIRQITTGHRVRSVTPASDASFYERTCLFGNNRLPTPKQPTFLELLWGAYNDPVLFLLTGAAAISLAIGLYKSFGTPHPPRKPSVEWVEGVAILLAIVVIVLVGAVNDWQKQRQFQKLNKRQLQRDVRVIRSGVSGLIPIAEVLVGDVVHIEPGDIIPADGILIHGYTVTCDESSVTGEGDLVHKTSGDDAFQEIQDEKTNWDASISHQDPFILLGTKVLDGVGTFVVTATGINSTYGKILASLRDEHEPTPLQVRLTAVAKYISNAGGVVAIILFIALFIKFLALLPHNHDTPEDKGRYFVDIVIIALTVLVIAVPEGLPLTVTLSLAFASTRMLKDNNLVRQLTACETMGNATNICSDKTGTLTQNQMVVSTYAVTSGLQFVADGYSAAQDSLGKGASGEANTFSSLPQSLFAEVASIVRQSIALNTMAFEGHNSTTFVGSNTESALLEFGRRYLKMNPVAIERSAAQVTQVIPFNATRQCMATIIQLPNSGSRCRVFIKGASEVLLAKCSKMLQDPTASSTVMEMTMQTRELLSSTIGVYADNALRTICLAYKDIDIGNLSVSASSPIDGLKTDFSLNQLLEDLVFVGVFGIQDPLRPGVPEAVATCQKAGVTVRMVTGDNIRTARAIAKQCGIYSESEADISMEGAQFRRLTDEEIKQTLPHLKVLARSSPQDKEKLVRHLQEMGEIVAVTGDGTNDAAALAAADVSFSMGGTSGTEVARDASSIILMTDDFACITKALMWGRAVNDSVRKFLQFQITITLTSILLTFISAIANPNEKSVLTPVQLMWVNLFQDTMAALALATDVPVARLLNRKPESRSAPLITIPMWKTIIGHTIYQMIVTLILYFAGAKILSYTSVKENAQLETLIFNTYVWLQIFNMYNDRQHDNTLNVFEGMLRNWMFMAVSSIMIGAQILIIFVGGEAFSVEKLDGSQWAISLVLGALSLPLGVLIRLIPDAPFERTVKALEQKWKTVIKGRRKVAGEQ